MDTFDAIRERRAVEHFDPSHQLTQQEAEERWQFPPLKIMPHLFK
jgi:hypothetical protein